VSRASYCLVGFLTVTEQAYACDSMPKILARRCAELGELKQKKPGRQSALAQRQSTGRAAAIKVENGADGWPL